MPMLVIASDRIEHDISENTLDDIMYGDFLNATLQNVQIDGAAAVGWSHTCLHLEGGRDVSSITLQIKSATHQQTEVVVN